MGYTLMFGTSLLQITAAAASGDISNHLLFLMTRVHEVSLKELSASYFIRIWFCTLQTAIYIQS